MPSRENSRNLIPAKMGKNSDLRKLILGLDIGSDDEEWVDRDGNAFDIFEIDGDDERICKQSCKKN